jgi:hypothetical protein
MLDCLTVSDPRAAAVLSVERQRRILLSLVEAEHSSGELAALTETPFNLLNHHIRKFLALGLIEVTRSQKRAGTPIRYYRAVARTFFAPVEHLSELPGSGLSERLRAELDRAFGASVQGVMFGHGPDGVTMGLVRDVAADRSFAIERWQKLRLTADDAKALAHDLQALMRVYEARNQDAGRPFMLHAALAPWGDV